MIELPRLLAIGFVSPLWLWALGEWRSRWPFILAKADSPHRALGRHAVLAVGMLEQNSRRLRMESLLLLLVRCGLLALLAFALSEPFQESESAIAAGTQSIHRILVIDGSLSMSAPSGSGSRFDLALQKAREIVEQSAVGDSFNLCRVGSASPAIIIRRPAHDPADVLREIDRLQLLDDLGDVAGTPPSGQ